MIDFIKTPAALTACFVIAAACSSSPAKEKSAQGVEPASTVTTELAANPKASPVNLELLASLASAAEEQPVATALKVPAETTGEEAPGILPAKTSTFSRDRVLIPVDRETAFKTQDVPIILDNSDLLEGTVYENVAPAAPKRPKMTPGTFRTIEYKKN